MARIRTIKPEYWTSEQIMECSTNARLMFIGLWNFCDDAGRMAASAKRIKASIFPSDDFTSHDVRRMLDELSANDLIHLYVVDGKEYLQVTGWHHQKIDRPQKSKLPDPPEPISPNGRRTFGVGREGNGREGKGEEGKSEGPASDPHPASRTLQEAGSAPTAASEAEPGLIQPWNGKANFDRVHERCREALGSAEPQDLRIGPIAKLEADGLDLEREIIPALLDVAAAAKTPIRTWMIFADRAAERVMLQRQSRAAQGLSPVPPAPTAAEDLVDLGVHGRWPEDTLRTALLRFRETKFWAEGIFGPPPGEPRCRIPARLLIGEAA
ncbi:hypothetical protein [Methylobacterium oxalidis]|uniref:hypothetical protein n=1 Tax=Methylobacterium oxalidis TaxID=944322 RepID=UPI00331452E8